MPEKVTVNVEIVEAGEEHEPVLDNLARYYTYDCAEFVDADFSWYRCQADGTFNFTHGKRLCSHRFESRGA